MIHLTDWLVCTRRELRLHLLREPEDPDAWFDRVIEFDLLIGRILILVRAIIRDRAKSL